ncbi:MAG: hypothetical protein ACRC7D_22630 [Aeromonas popoffii]|uniref:hypothetical protein n=1 Tax=Aeromonas popoffii TaxID=70856 RepID=UPI003F3C87CF
MKKDEVERRIAELESQLSMAVAESNCWNTGKYKNSSVASVSKVYVESLRKDIFDLKARLTSLG